MDKIKLSCPKISSLPEIFLKAINKGWSFFRNHFLRWKNLLWGLHLVMAIFLIIFFSGWIAVLWAQDNLGNPEYCGQLKVKFIDKNKKLRYLSLEPNCITKIPFTYSNKIWFYYGIKREKSFDCKPGAIVVKVTYIYAPKSKNDIEEWAQLASLYRNEFPNTKILDSAIPFELYQQYHKRDMANYFLRHRFHAIFPIDQKTDGTYQRKEIFVFATHDQSDQRVARHRSYLLFYSGVQEGGTWIDFDVGITNSMSDLYVTISDLGEPGTDLGETRWQISRE